MTENGTRKSHNPADSTVLVLGATGKTGSRVVRRLQARAVAVREGSRGGTPRFDWDDQTTWEPVVRGVTAAYIAFSPDAGFPGAADTIRAFAELAVASGVERLVLLSGRGEAGALRSEQAVRDSGAEWTVVRSSFFAQNFSEDFLVEGIRDGVVAFPARDVGEPFVDVEDLAEIAVAALTEDGHGGQVYEVTGPRLLTFPAAVAEIAEACGRTIDYVAPTPREFAAGLIRHGLPGEFAAQLTGLFEQVLDGRNATVCDGVHRALGREPRDFTDYVRDTTATGVWNPGA